MNTAAEPGWLEQLEQSLEILRRGSLSAWLCYLVGMLPFVLVLVFYLLEMLQSAMARRKLVGLSLAVSLVFLWKQCWQAAFVARLRDELAGESTPWTAGRLFILITRQAFWQPMALVILPASVLSVAAFPIALGFFREMALGAGRGEPVPVGTALRAAGGDVRSHAFALAGVGLMALLLWLNVLITMLMVPQLGQSIFGIVTAWSQMGGLLANRVMVSLAMVFVWMLLDPLLDAFYLQRSFRKESRVSGADLRSALRRLPGVAMMAVMLAPALLAQTLTAQSQAQQLDPQQIEQAAKKVLAQDDYVWRGRAVEAEEGPILSWFRQVGQWMQEKIDGFFEWFRKLFRRNRMSGVEGEGGGVTATLEWLLYGLSGIIIALALVLFYRSWRRAQALRANAAPAVQLTKVDVADESVAADALEEAGWLTLADELIAQGDFRLALRALHLAGLRYLGGKGHVSLARWKSGYDYQRELGRRLRSEPRVAELFGGNLLRFEMTWYGRHAATADGVEAARDTWKEIRTHAR